MENIQPGAIKYWSTSDVPEAERLDYFAAALTEAVFPVTIGRADARSFHATTSFAHVASLGVCKTSAASHSGFRGRTELARSIDHCFSLVLTLQSRWTADHRGSLQMLPHDVLIFDSEYPLKVTIHEEMVAINVGVSEPWLRQWLPNPNVLTARRIPGNSLGGHALSSYLSGLSPQLAAAPPLPLSFLADQVGSLLLLTASGMAVETFTNTKVVRSLRERIQDCLMQRCMEWQLTATHVATSLSISLRTLHRTFAATNETFGEALMDARARVAIRMLTSPSFNRLTTAEIGRRAGFPSASHFARVIRDRTGRSPLQLRHAIDSDRLEREVVDSDEANGQK
jgi:AraC-like DNA-binding protein